MWFGLWMQMAVAAPPDAWEATLAEVAPAVVALEVTATRDFDTETAGTVAGTGFVVDADLGLILTNRHLVQAGPVIARATFLDHEEADLQPVYRDPVHDYGIYRFDPSVVRYLDVPALQLSPEAARVGAEIRVVGNDAGEKLSILDGTLARLDRNAPDYGADAYNDLNTFYLQAASNTSGGSSGSPVIDVEGRVVGLNAGGTTSAAQSFYLPLERVRWALERLRAGQDVPRGGLLTTFVHTPFESLARLGLSPSTEARVRAERPGGAGMLVVDRVTPGPAQGVLEVGDVLVEVDGALCTDFVALDAVLDARVGEGLDLVVERRGARVEVSVLVEDLHAVTPRTFLEVGRAVVHPLSYQVARHHQRFPAGVYVATAGHMLAAAGVRRGDVIEAVHGTPVRTVDDVQQALVGVADGAPVRVRYAPVGAPGAVREGVAPMDRTWFAMRRCTLAPGTGLWPCTDAPPPPEAAPPTPPDTTWPVGGPRKVRRVAQALVQVDFRVPYSTAGIGGTRFVGTGTVVDAAHGLVLVDRDTVPVALGDLWLTFRGTVRVPGRVAWLHPEHNAAFVRYDPVALGDLEVTAVPLSRDWIAPGDDVRVVGLDGDGRVLTSETTVDDVDWLYLDPPRTPRFRDMNVEVAQLGEVLPTVGGVVVDRRGRGVALWAWYATSDDEGWFYALPSPYLAAFVDILAEGRTPAYHAPDVELSALPLAEARQRGMSDARIRAHLDHDPDSLRVFEVVRTAGEGGALAAADVVLTAGGTPLTRMRDVAGWWRFEGIDLVVLRNGHEVRLRQPLSAVGSDTVTEVLSLGGMVVHDPHRAVAFAQRTPGPGPYIAWYWWGSPAARDRMLPMHRIVRVGDTPVRDLAHLRAIVAGHTPARPLILTLADLSGATAVRALELDPLSWPTEWIGYEEASGRWSRTRVAPARP